MSRVGRLIITLHTPLVITLAMLTTKGCAIKHERWYGYAPTVDAAAIPSLWNWAGSGAASPQRLWPPTGGLISWERTRR